MAENIVARLEKLSRRTAALTDLVATMRSQAPQDIEGWDSTGAVRALLGADGLPTAVHVEHNWRQLVSPELLGSAVMEASSAAVSEQMAVWSHTLGTLPQPGRVDRLETEPPPNPAPSLGAHRPARDFGELTEDVLRSLTEVRRQTRASSEPGVGSHRSRHVTVELSPARLTSCTIDAAWAARQSGHDLSTVLTQAIAAARGVLDKEQRLGPARADGLVSDALTALNRFCAQAEEATRRNV